MGRASPVVWLLGEAEDWTPTSADGLVLWVDGSDITKLYQDDGFTTPVTADSDPIGGIRDKSSAGNDGTQATAKPVYKTDIRNGLSCIQHNSGVAKYINHGNDSSLQNTTFSIFFVGKPYDLTRGLLTKGTSRAGPSNCDWDIFGNNTDLVGRVDNVGETVGGGIHTVAWHVWELHWDGTTNPGGIKVYLDGELHDTATASSTSINNTHSVYLGGGSTASYNIGLYTGEVLIYDNRLSEADRVAAVSYLNAKWDIYWDGSQQGILDSYPAKVAYGIRNLSSSYTGPLVKLRRASDNAEEDFYGDYSGNLRIDDITTWDPAGVAYVTTWYDQSGNGNNLTMSTAAQQPLFVLSDQNSLPVLEFDGTDDRLSWGSPWMYNATTYSYFYAFNPLADGQTNESFFNVSDQVNANRPGIWRNGTGDTFTWRTGDASETELTGTIDIADRFLIASAHSGSTTFYGYINGESDGSVAITQSSGYSNLAHWLGSRGASAEASARIGEFIGFVEDKSANRPAIETDIAQYWNLWIGASAKLLDTYAVSAAYSTRNLSSTYVSALLRLRRASDNEEINWCGSYSGELDTTAIGAWAGGNAYVVSWFDQSGNGYDATQATSTDQPLFVSSDQNSKPVINFDSSDYLVTAAVAPKGATGAVYFISNSANINQVRPAFSVDCNGGSDEWMHFGYNFNTFSRANLYNRGTAKGSYGDTVIQNNIYDLISANSNGKMYVNSIEQTLTAHGSQWTGQWFDVLLGNAAYVIGARDPLGAASFKEHLIGDVAEVIVRDSTSNRASIENNMNGYWQIYWDGSLSGLLDSYPATVAYSTRNLSSSYTGPLVKLRRASDNAEADFYGDYSGNLRAADIAAWDPAGVAYVTTWYDQSGNGYNIVQTTAANQPLYVASGQNSLPVFDFDGTNDCLEKTGPTGSNYLWNDWGFSLLAGVSDFTSGCICDYVESTSGSFYKGILRSGYSPGPGPALVARDAAIEETNYIVCPVDYKSALIIANFGGNSANEGFVNGTSIGTIPANITFGSENNRFAVGYMGDNTPGPWCNGQIFEVIGWPSLLSSANRNAIENNVNSYWNLYWDGSQSGLLNSYPAVAAYSTRNLSGSYTGPLVRLRRASDNEELDIYGDYNGNLRTADIATWDPAGVAYVTTWYDQSGNGNNAVETTTAKQPLFVASGQNSLPVLDFTNASAHDLRTAAFSSALSQPFTFTLGFKLDAGVVNNDSVYHAFDGISGGNRSVFAQYSAPTPDKWALHNGAWLSGPATDSNAHIATNIIKSTSSEMWLDGGLAVTGNAGTDTLTGVTIGERYDNNGTSWEGTIFEVILFAGNQTNNRSIIDANLNSYWSVW